MSFKGLTSGGGGGPTLYRFDDFDRPDAYPSNTPTDGLGDYTIGNVGVESNYGSSYGGFGYVYPAGLEAGTADVSVSVTLVSFWDVGQPCGPALRVDGSNFVGLAAEGFGSSLSIVLYGTFGPAGSGTVLANCGSFAQWDVVTLTAIGDEYRAYKNGVLVGTATGVTTNQSVTTHGIFCSSIRGRNDLDDLEIYINPSF